MHVLITGGAGFIGSHIAEMHFQRGDRVHVLDDLSTGSISNIQPFLGDPNFRFDHADILEWGGLVSAVGWADRIYHMAAMVGMMRVLTDPIGVMTTNIIATNRLMRAIRASGWKPEVIMASTSEVYGPTDVPLLRESDPLVVKSSRSLRWNYAISKLCDEALAISYNCCEARMKTVVLRLFNTIGPRQAGQYGMVVPRFVKAALEGKDLEVFGDGHQTRSFCDVRDTVQAMDQLAGCDGAWGEIVNLGNDQELSILDLAHSVIKLLGSKSGIKMVSYEDAYGMSFDEVPRRRPDLTKLRSLIDFQPQRKLDQTILDIAKHLETKAEV